MLDFIYYPVSAVLWVWHTVFAAVLGASSGLAWVLAIVFLVLTLRALLLRSFFAQAKFQRGLVKLQPEFDEIKRKHAGDLQKQGTEMQRVRKENGVSMLSGCLPILGQGLVFLGLFHVLRSFKSADTANYVFSPEQVQSFLQAKLFGAPLAATITGAGDSVVVVAAVAIPLMIIAAIATHFTARFSVARQLETGVEPTSQTRIMNTLSLWVFPAGAIVAGAIMPVAILLYFVTQNAWTFAQQHLIYRRLDAEPAAAPKPIPLKDDSLVVEPAAQAGAGNGNSTGRRRPVPTGDSSPKQLGDSARDQRAAGSGRAAGRPRPRVHGSTSRKRRRRSAH